MGQREEGHDGREETAASRAGQGRKGRVNTPLSDLAGVYSARLSKGRDCSLGTQAFHEHACVVACSKLSEIAPTQLLRMHARGRPGF